MRKALRNLIRERARRCCEYCRFPEEFSEFPFVPDHIHAIQHLGATDQNNLAWCCGFCNRHKGPNVAGVDPETRKVVAIFNPRTQRWKDHFR